MVELSVTIPIAKCYPNVVLYFGCVGVDEFAVCIVLGMEKVFVNYIIYTKGNSSKIKLWNCRWFNKAIKKN